MAIICSNCGHLNLTTVPTNKASGLVPNLSSLQLRAYVAEIQSEILRYKRDVETLEAKQRQLERAYSLPDIESNLRINSHLGPHDTSSTVIGEGLDEITHDAEDPDDEQCSDDDYASLFGSMSPSGPSTAEENETAQHPTMDLGEDGGANMEAVYTETNQEHGWQDNSAGQVVNAEAPVYSLQSQAHSSPTQRTEVEHDKAQMPSPGLCPEPTCSDVNGRFTTEHMLTHKLNYRFKYRSRAGNNKVASFARWKDLLFHCPHCGATFPSSTGMEEHISAEPSGHSRKWTKPGPNNRLAAN
ncbi:hypothetical protein DFH06DRAFT_1427799 [Mycena polygramma]|nr:hypothetical protein DFH06DRAFT_1427799 [Mycena polygramma]